MPDALKIGIIGAGNMGRAHWQSIAAYGAQVSAVHDIRLTAAEKLAAGSSVEVVTDNLDTFFEQELDGVVITTPPPVRLDPIRRACERGIHLMVEKPPALNVREARACLRHIEKAGVIAAVGFQLRYMPLYQRLKELLSGQAVHLVRTVCTVDYYLTFRMSPWFLQHKISGGPIAEQAIHLLDCVRYILGNAKPVQAHALAVKNMALERSEFDAENAVQMTYQLDNGVFGVHTNHCGTERFSFDLEVIGPHLRLQANVTNNRIVGYFHRRDIDEVTPPASHAGLDKTGAWLRAIETGNRSLVLCDFAEGLNTLLLVEAAINSQETGKFVRVDKL